MRICFRTEDIDEYLIDVICADIADPVANIEVTGIPNVMPVNSESLKFAISCTKVWQILLGTAHHKV